MKAKTLYHNLERTWPRSRTHLDHSRYKHQCHLCNGMMTKTKSKYVAEVISENSDNPRHIWTSINNILHNRIPPPAVPEFTSVKLLCDHFMIFSFDCSLNFQKHISKTCRACFYNIRDLRRIRKSLSLDLAKQIAEALVSSKLDYCISLFHNMPEKDIARLQCVQNRLARVVTKAPRFSHSVPILK